MAAEATTWTEMTPDDRLACAQEALALARFAQGDLDLVRSLDAAVTAGLAVLADPQVRSLLVAARDALAGSRRLAVAG